MYSLQLVLCAQVGDASVSNDLILGIGVGVGGAGLLALLLTAIYWRKHLRLSQRKTAPTHEQQLPLSNLSPRARPNAAQDHPEGISAASVPIHLAMQNAEGAGGRWVFVHDTPVLVPVRR